MDAQEPVRKLTQQADCSTTEQVSESRNRTWKKLADPHAWALKWDRFALFGAQNRRDSDDPSPSGETR